MLRKVPNLLIDMMLIPKKRDTQKLEKITAKMNKSINKRELANTAYKNYDSEAWKVMGQAAQNNYRINSKQVIRNGEKGRSYLQYALAGPVGDITVNMIRSSYYTGSYQTTNKRTGATIDRYP